MAQTRIKGLTLEYFYTQDDAQLVVYLDPLQLLWTQPIHMGTNIQLLDPNTNIESSNKVRKL